MAVKYPAVVVDNWMEYFQIQFLPVANVFLLKVFYFLTFQMLLIGIFFPWF